MNKSLELNRRGLLR